METFISLQNIPPTYCLMNLVTLFLFAAVFFKHHLKDALNELFLLWFCNLLFLSIQKQVDWKHLLPYVTAVTALSNFWKIFSLCSLLDDMWESLSEHQFSIQAVLWRDVQLHSFFEGFVLTLYSFIHSIDLVYERSEQRFTFHFTVCSWYQHKFKWNIYRLQHMQM